MYKRQEGLIMRYYYNNVGFGPEEEEEEVTALFDMSIM